MEGKTRDSNIELLRILTICGVIVLHYNGTFGLDAVQKQTNAHYFLLVLESMFICAVDLFVLISGYFLSTSNKRRVVKVVELLVNVSVLWMLRYIIFGWVLGTPVYMRDVLRSAIPDNYFVTLYLTVYLVSPYLNYMVQRLKKREIRNLLILMIILFSVIPTCFDVLRDAGGTWHVGMYPISFQGSQNGYTIVNFLLMYLIGAYLRCSENKPMKWWVCLVCYGAITVLLTWWQQTYEISATSYCNPFVIAEAVVVFQLFQQMRFRSKVVNTLAKSVFTCYLLHSWFMPYLHIPEAVSLGGKSILLHLAVVVPGLYLLCWCVWKLYSFVMNPMMHLLGKWLSPLDRYISVEGD